MSKETQRGIFNIRKAYNITPNPEYSPDPRINPKAKKYPDKDDAVTVSAIVEVLKDPKDYSTDTELHRTLSTICVTDNGRIFAGYYTGTAGEEAGNYIVINKSDDDGKTFHPFMTIRPAKPDTIRLMDFTLWIDDTGRFWIFYTQCYMEADGRMGVWYVRCDSPDGEDLKFTAPKRISNGITMAKPVILSSGDWILPVHLSNFLWAQEENICHYWLNFLPDEMGSGVLISKDRGETWEKGESVFYAYGDGEEPSVVELSDGTLKMYIRGRNSVAETFSKDKGKTWKMPHENRDLYAPNTHFYCAKLQSGNLLFILNYKSDMYSYYHGRNNLTAMISRDEGKTWEGFLMLDERDGTEQPDFFQAKDGRIYISYGRAPQIAGESLMAVVTEEDVLAGKLIDPRSRLKVLTSKATGIKFGEDYERFKEISEKYNIEM